MAEESEGPGQALRAGRKARGLSVEEVAESLMLSVATVRALEKEDWSRMPAPVFVRGYIRDYAGLVGLDEDTILSRYEGTDGRVSKDQPVDLTPVDLYLGKQRFRWALMILAGLAMVAAVGWVVIQWMEGGPAEELAAVEAAAGTPVPEPSTAAEEAMELPSAPPAAGPVVQDADEVAAQDGLSPQAAESSEDFGANDALLGQDGGLLPSPLPEPSLIDEAASGAMPDAAPDSPLPEPDGGQPAASIADGQVPAAASADEGDILRLTPTGDAQLRFEFSEECWVEIKDMDGDFLYADLGRPNQALRLVGEGPFDIKLGYAPGVVLLFNGMSVPLAPHTRDYVATLVLGR